MAGEPAAVLALTFTLRSLCAPPHPLQHQHQHQHHCNDTQKQQLLTKCHSWKCWKTCGEENEGLAYLRHLEIEDAATLM